MERNRVIDNLRGFSVLMVFYFHIYLIWNNMQVFVFKEAPVLSAFGNFWLKWGTYGVDLFFTLSGFLIAQSLSRKFDLRDFYLKRFARIFPLYYSVVLFNTFVYWLGSQTAMPTDPTELATRTTIYGWNAANTPYFFAFLASYRPHFGPDFAGHLWSLAVEEHFYLTFPILVYYFREKIAYVCIGIFTLLMAWRGYVCFFAPEVFYDTLYHHTHTRIMGIFLGAILYYKRELFQGWNVATVFAIAATLFYGLYDGLKPNKSYLNESASFMMMTSEYLKHMFPSMTIALIIANFHDVQWKNTKWLIPNEKLGKASLSFYVCGFIANCMVSFAFSAQKSKDFGAYAIAVTVLTLIFSISCYYIYEKFLFNLILRLGRKHVVKKENDSTPAVEPEQKAS